MLQIKDTLVSLDLIERHFCCDIRKCLGQCCVEGESGAPVTVEEVAAIEEVMPAIKDELLPQAREVIGAQGISYVDDDGDLVTSIVGCSDCVFTNYLEGGVCICLLEKAFREGRIPDVKPSSCYLYPVRLDRIGSMTAVNLHRWQVCRSAEVNGREKGIRAYEFLRGPLTKYFGEEWYAELETVAKEWLSQHGK